MSAYFLEDTREPMIYFATTSALALLDTLMHTVWRGSLEIWMIMAMNDIIKEIVSPSIFCIF